MATPLTPYSNISSSNISDAASYASSNSSTDAFLPPSLTPLAPFPTNPSTTDIRQSVSTYNESDHYREGGEERDGDEEEGGYDTYPASATLLVPAKKRRGIGLGLGKGIWTMGTGENRRSIEEWGEKIEDGEMKNEGEWWAQRGKKEGMHTVLKGNLRREMKRRHVVMISLAGVIGTGLFLGTGQSLANGGPVGLLLGYTIWGTIAIAMMVALASMISHLPLTGGHIALATRLVDPAFSFNLGWTYCLHWSLSLPVQLSAAVVLVHFWTDNRNLDALWITILLVVVYAINATGAKIYGETEFWFGSIKVVTIVGLIITGIVVDLGGGPNKDRLGFRYWKDPGPFVQYFDIAGAKGRFLGFWRVLIQAAFAYNGTEIIAITSGEARNPRKTLPKAVRGLFLRILLFYVLGVFVVGLLCPSNDPNLPGIADEDMEMSTGANSPFVIAFKRAGIRGLPSVINAAILASAWSAASSNLYTSSRSLYGLALSGGAPTWLLKTNRMGLPWLCCLITGSFGLLTYFILLSDAYTVFSRLQTFNSVNGLVTWWGILVTYLRFHKAIEAQNYKRIIPYRAPLQPWLSYYGIGTISLTIFFNGFANFLSDNFDAGIFIVSYFPVVLSIALFLGYRFYFKTSLIDIKDIDLDTGSRDALEEDDAPPRNIAEKWLKKLL